MMKFKIYRILICCFCLLMLLSCIDIPSYKKGQNSNVYISKAKNFKYGKFCGSNHPTFDSKPGTKERTKDLLSIWPPVDDVDLMCYAHDLCYQEVGGQNLICDQAISSIAIWHSNLVDQKSGCSNLSRLVGSGIGVKFWGSEKSGIAAKGISAANLLWTVPMTGLYNLMYQKEYDKHGFPENEGSCYFENKRRLHSHIIISDFEAQYREFAKGFRFYSRTDPGKTDIDIQIPFSGWKKKYMVFETQKYLNYFGYNAGAADGIFGNKTASAIRKFQKYKNSNLANKPSEKLLESLKNDYLNRPDKTRRADYVLSEDDKRKKYGYVLSLLSR